MVMNLDIQIVQKRLAHPAVARDINLFGVVASTNAALRELAAKAAPDGTCVIADEQSAGHGRLGKPWFSPPAVNLYLSALFRPNVAPRDAGGFAFVGSLALCDAIKGEGLEATIKWPNDVLVKGKKVAGVLAECATVDARVDYVMLGFGVNLNVTHKALMTALGPSGHFAGSLADLAGREIDRNAFAAALLNHLFQWVEIHRTEGPAALLAGWRDRDILTGRRVEVRGEGPSYEGRVLGVDTQGHLVVRDSLGKVHRVLAGEIRLSD
jgi:BirA family transcriptional regulator, biotin operon repressor / biotin---[acetyl-CoA-carboxylase] ligase